MFQHVLNGAASRLALPTLVGTSIVGDVETNAGHDGYCVGMFLLWQAGSEWTDALEWMQSEGSLA